MAVFNASGHCRSHSQCPMSLDEIVIREIQRDRSLKVFKLFAECVRQSCEPAAVHPQCVILFLDMRRGDAAYIGGCMRSGSNALRCMSRNTELNGHEDVVELLLANKADVNAKNNDGQTSLELAASLGYADIVKTLLANNADVNTKDNDGQTPLHLAASGDHKDVVELLLANKADVNAKNNDGLTPLQLAEDPGFADVVELLRQHGGHQ